MMVFGIFVVAKKLKRDKFSNSPRRTKVSKLKNNGTSTEVWTSVYTHCGLQWLTEWTENLAVDMDGCLYTNGTGYRVSVD